MGITITEVDPAEPGPDSVRVAALAREIWTQHYSSLIGADQVEYMLDRFQSPARIASDIAGGYRYWLAEDEGTPVAYCGAEPQSDALFMSKIYVALSHRGQGLARRFVEIGEDVCRELGLAKMGLTVNKYNAGSIAAYEHLGFKIVGTQVADIGSGYVMDDYIMEKVVE